MTKYTDLDCILLIDDDDATNFIHQMIIEKAEIDTHIEICNTAQKALDYLSCEGGYSNESKYPQPGIIFLDINMPGMDGWGFLERYKKLPDDQKAHMVVAMLTTSLNPDDEKKGTQDQNVKSFLHKPLTVEMIQEIAEKNFS